MDASHVHISTPASADPLINSPSSTSSKGIIATRRRPLSDYIALGSLVLDCDPDYFTADDDAAKDIFKPAQLIDSKYAFNDKKLLEPLVNLLLSGWIQALIGRFDKATRSEVLRVYLLPDDVARATIDGRDKKHEKMLQSIIRHIDVSASTWNGDRDSQDFGQPSFDPWATAEHSSLFYLFNTLPSPVPAPQSISNTQLRHSVQRLLEEDAPPWGLQTVLYPYQRKCVAALIQKENSQGLQLDPRLEKRQSPNGETYYYGPRDFVFFKTPRYFETCPGGILAETMGLGKTLICISMIVLTRGQYPSIPLQYDIKKTHSQVQRLSEICAVNLSKTGLPWKTFFEDYEDSTGYDMSSCKSMMDNQRPHYETPPRVVRSMRYADKFGQSEQVRLCHGTIVVVPLNLLSQWQNEFRKHVKDGALKMKVLKDTKEMIPTAEELCQYDIILFSLYRFKLENRTFTDVDYTSPLKQLHWLRIIIDEGHGFSSGATNAAAVAEKLIKAERRWIVTGTPARDLLGVEVDVPAMTSSESEEAFQKYKEISLENRRIFDETQERTSGAVKSIGALASKFLKAKPWSLAWYEEGGADWDDYIYKHADFRNRTYTSFSKCLRTTLQDIMIKTRPEDVEEDIRLPPLRHQVVRLDASPSDKMTANLFVLLFTTNAVTSERRDQDYLFHSKSRHHLQRLATNLRQSAFFWAGFNQQDIASSLKTGEKYLNKHGTHCPDSDRRLLIHIMDMVEQILSSSTWKALAQSSEMGMFVEDWPLGAETAWAFEDCVDPPMIGLSQVSESQKFVNNRLTLENPLDDFEAAGRTANQKILEEEVALQEGSLKKEPDNNGLSSDKSGIPSSGYGTGSMGTKRLSATGIMKVTPKKSKRKDPPDANATETKATERPTRKRKLSIGSTAIDLDPGTELGRTRLIGTVSSKFSYLIDRISALENDEKILVFYDANYVAYYLSQALDLLDIKHLIYANSLSSQLRSEYTVLFDTDASQRVLIMDLKQAAHGLNLSAASRVFFVNPPWRPDVEAQAIKRAHRIGQTRPVHVETLVLKGTVEEAMYERAATMTNREHLAAKTLEDDNDIRSIIQNQKILPLTPAELHGKSKMAPLQTPQQLFGRPGRAKKSKAGKLETEIFGSEEAQAAAGAGEAKDTGPPKKCARKTQKGKAGKARVSFAETPTVDGALAGGSNSAAPEGVAAAEASIFGGG